VKFEKEVIIDAPCNEIFSFHERKGALKRLSPPWQNIEVVWEKGGILPGGEVKMNMHDSIRIPWQARHIEYEKNSFFSDIQISGPFSSWAHEHYFNLIDEKKTLMKDSIECSLPLSGLTKIFNPIIRKKLERIFFYRHKILKRDMSLNMKYPVKKKILISGGSGLLGQMLNHRLSTAGHDVRFLIRRPPKQENEFLWNPDKRYVDMKAFNDIDAVINLSGEPIGEGIWTKLKKERIEKSRIVTASFISEIISCLDSPPELFISSSATGYYGNRHEEILSEESEKGDLFISKICDKWEKAALSYVNDKTRTVLLRTGIVLSPEGGALPLLWKSVLAGFPVIPGRGDQYISWISSEDWLKIVYHLIFESSIDGAVNAVSPSPVTLSKLIKTMSKIYKRPAIFNIPESIFSFFGGKKAYETILCGAKVLPLKLQKEGFSFFHNNLEDALVEMLGKEVNS